MEAHLPRPSSKEPGSGCNEFSPIWRDLREWIMQTESHELLKRIKAVVDPDEELGAITLLATRQDNAPALLFETMRGDTTNSRILTNMLGASKERYALAVGLDPTLSTAEMISATRSIDDQIGRANYGSEESGARERGRADRKGHRPNQIPGAEILAR